MHEDFESPVVQPNIGHVISGATAGALDLQAPNVHLDLRLIFSWLIPARADTNPEEAEEPTGDDGVDRDRLPRVTVRADCDMLHPAADMPRRRELVEKYVAVSSEKLAIEFAFPAQGHAARWRIAKRYYDTSAYGANCAAVDALDNA